MRPDVKEQWEWADCHFPAIRKILWANADKWVRLEKSNPQDDMKRGTDMVIAVDDRSIALRVRDPFTEQFMRLPPENERDFTIRSRVKGAEETELDKIDRPDFAQWYFYGWSDRIGGFIDWRLFDIRQLVKSGLIDKVRCGCGYHQIPNNDGNTAFVYITEEEYRAVEEAVIAEKAIPEIPF